MSCFTLKYSDDSNVIVNHIWGDLDFVLNYNWHVDDPFIWIVFSLSSIDSTLLCGICKLVNKSVEKCSQLARIFHTNVINQININQHSSKQTEWLDKSVWPFLTVSWWHTPRDGLLLAIYSTSSSVNLLGLLSVSV